MANAEVAPCLVGPECESHCRGASGSVGALRGGAPGAALSAQGRRIVVADPGKTTDDLVRDMIEVLTSMCARLYGRRGARDRALRAVTATKKEPVSA